MGPAANAFLAEAEELLTSLEERLLELEDTAAPGPLVDAVFRALHTLKGSGDMFGFSALAGFVHHFETTFEAVRAGTQPITPELLAVSLASRDHLAALLALGPDAEVGEPLTSAGNALLARLAAVAGPDSAQRDLAGDADATQTAVGGTDAAPTPARCRAVTIDFRPAPEALRNGFRPDLLFEELAGLGALEIACHADDVPQLEMLDATACYLWWRMTLITEASHEAIETVFIFVDDGDLEITEAEETTPTGISNSKELASLGDADTAETERSGAAPSPSAGGARARDQGRGPSVDQGPGARADAPPAARAAETIRVPASKLDELMDQLGELVIGQARLRRVARDMSDPMLNSVSEEIERLVTGLRDTTLSIRMLPIGQAFGRFRRVVRDLSRELGKPVTLVTVGGETEVDKNVLDSLGEPLVHLVRNAIDHGIEDSARRLAAGKPAEATITLSARQSGGDVLVSIEDDGGGLDTAAIRRRAIERGMIEADADLPDSAIHQLIFAAGFSTAETVSALSGRGVGMDAVRRVIEDLRGTVEIRSETGRGCVVTLRLPLTLAIIEGLLVRVGENSYVLPLTYVEECVELPSSSGHHGRDRSLTTIRDQLVPYLDLSSHFAPPLAPAGPTGTEGDGDSDGDGAAGPTDTATAAKAAAEARAKRRVIVVRLDTGRTGLVIDEILGQHQTVIKPLSAFHNQIPGMAGCTILGDGAVAIILDPAALVKAAAGTEIAA
ncbi:MAG: chemotaxis protein CheA [Pseudomonadota bacterium]